MIEDGGGLEESKGKELYLKKTEEILLCNNNN